MLMELQPPVPAYGTVLKKILIRNIERELDKLVCQNDNILSAGKCSFMKLKSVYGNIELEA